MIDPPWMPRTEEEYRQQLAEDAGPQPDEMVRLQMDLDAVAAERDAALREVERLTAEVSVLRSAFEHLERDHGCTAYSRAPVTLRSPGESPT